MSRELLFILPTYGHFDYAELCHNSFVRHGSTSSHVLVVDDASPEWFQSKFSQPAMCKISCIRFPSKDGLTRSWNAGLRFARHHGFEYAICGNSDLLFTKGWYPPLKTALNEGHDLAGPVTNAPGDAPWQNINNFVKFEPTDDPAILDRYADELRGQPSAQDAQFINGFFLIAKTKTWWDGAFDAENVFNPIYRLTGNEKELQQRWREQGKRIGFVPRSFVFHYRSVSRPEALGKKVSKGAFRRVSPPR